MLKPATNKSAAYEKIFIIIAAGIISAPFCGKRRAITNPSAITVIINPIINKIARTGMITKKLGGGTLPL